MRRERRARVPEVRVKRMARAGRRTAQKPQSPRERVVAPGRSSGAWVAATAMPPLPR